MSRERRRNRESGRGPELGSRRSVSVGLSHEGRIESRAHTSGGREVLLAEGDGGVVRVPGAELVGLGVHGRGHRAVQGRRGQVGARTQRGEVVPSTAGAGAGGAPRKVLGWRGLGERVGCLVGWLITWGSKIYFPPRGENNFTGWCFQFKGVGEF